MDRQRVLRRRLATQRLTASPLASAADAVRLLLCVQSQERDHSFFALAQRSRATTYAAVRAEHDAGAFVRTHVLRPTWHHIAPDYPSVGFPFADGVPEPEGFPLYTAVVVDETRVGTWRRTVQRDRVVVETRLAPGTTSRQHALVDAAVEGLGRFLERPVERVRA